MKTEEHNKLIAEFMKMTIQEQDEYAQAYDQEMYYQEQEQQSINQNKKTMKTFENLQAEVEKIGKKSKATSAEIDLNESYSGIETFDADLVIDKLNTLATFHENLSVKHYEYSEQNLNDSADWWAENADAHYQASKEVRKSMTYIIRTQKQRNYEL